MEIIVNISSDFTEKATPVPIPNTAVKLLEVDGTCLARGWESRTSLGLFGAPRNRSPFFVSYENYYWNAHHSLIDYNL